MKITESFTGILLLACSLLILLTAMFVSKPLSAKAYKMPAENARLIGHDFTHEVVKGDYFQKIAEQYNVGFLALMSANPNVDPFLPEQGAKITIPSAMLLPYISFEGIVINLPELRLYYFSPQAPIVHVFPVGIGKEGLATPIVSSYISEKRKDPIWRPTQAMRERYFNEHGVAMVKEVAAGPDNPFGKYALRIGDSEYLIHGTNKRFGIGMRASSGCIRMFDDDIKWMYDNIPLNTKVRIINQPIKMSYEAGKRQLIEVHLPLSIDSVPQAVRVTPAVKNFIGDNQAFWQQLAPVFTKPTGLVQELGQ